jgi:hypothetical protein
MRFAGCKTMTSTYYIYACSAAEYAKADKDPTYAPKEHRVGTLVAECEQQAERLFWRGIKSGKFPAGSNMVPQ